jgi:hypothetical protein
MENATLWNSLSTSFASSVLPKIIDVNLGKVCIVFESTKFKYRSQIV